MYKNRSQLFYKIIVVTKSHFKAEVIGSSECGGQTEKHYILNIVIRSCCHVIDMMPLRSILMVNGEGYTLHHTGNHKNSSWFFKDVLKLTQLVNKPTHDKGSILDQVWVNHMLNNRVEIKKKCVRYSDHDVLKILIVKQ